MIASARTTPSIRPATSHDIPKLGPVESSAGALFRTIPSLSKLADYPPLSPRLLRPMARENHIWVAVESNDEPVAFLAGQAVDDCFHVVEVSVTEAWQGKGVGKALIRRMENDVKKEGFEIITLTTYRYVPWNGPWYSSVGFKEVDAASLGKGHVDIVKEEEAHHDIARRCCMSKSLLDGI